jgi:hypothetical protein
MAAAVYPNAAAAAGACTPSVMNRTSAFNGTHASAIEIIHNDTTVRALRRAYCRQPRARSADGRSLEGGGGR